MSITDTVKNAVGLGDKDEGTKNATPAKSTPKKSTPAKTASRTADTTGSTDGGRTAHATPTDSDAAKNEVLATEIARASDAKAAIAVSKPDAPIASGLVRHGLVGENDPERIDPLEGTEYAANVQTNTFEAHFRFSGDEQKVQDALEKLVGELEGAGGAVILQAELRHGPASNIQVEPLVSPKRRKQMEAEAKTNEANAKKVAEDTRRTLEERRAAAGAV